MGAVAATTCASPSALRIAIMDEVRVQVSTALELDRVLPGLRGSEGAVEERRRLQASVDALAARVAALSRERQRLYELYACGGVTLAEYKEMQAEADGRAAVAGPRSKRPTAELEDFDALLASDAAFEEAVAALEDLFAFSRDLVLALVRRIEVGRDGGIVIEFRFGDWRDRVASRAEARMIALYMRLSRADGDLEGEGAVSNSIANQRAILRSFVERDPGLSCQPVEEFVDDGFSGSSFDRPEVQRMLALCKEGRVSCIIVKDLSRFAREYIDAGTYIEQVFPFLRVRFVSVASYDSAACSLDSAAPGIAIRNIANAASAGTRRSACAARCRRSGGEGYGRTPRRRSATWWTQPTA